MSLPLWLETNGWRWATRRTEKWVGVGVPTWQLQTATWKNEKMWQIKFKNPTKMFCKTLQRLVTVDLQWTVKRPFQPCNFWLNIYFLRKLFFGTNLLLKNSLLLLLFLRTQFLPKKQQLYTLQYNRVSKTNIVRLLNFSLIKLKNVS